MQVEPKSLIISDRIYSLLLHAYPASFRQDYGPHLAQVFRDEIRDTLRDNGPAGIVALWLFSLTDLLKTALTEHIWEVFHMPLEKLERWTGLAAALGGALLVFLTLSITQLQQDEFVVLAVLAFVMFLMWAIALAGLYRRLPAASHPGSKVTFAIAITSLSLSVIGLLILPLTEFGVTMISVGYIGMGLSLAGMGIIALRYRALAVWSFVPLLIAVTWLGFIMSMIMEGYSLEGPITLALALLNGIGWLLLGIGLWTSAKEGAGPALPA